MTPQKEKAIDIVSEYADAVYEKLTLTGDGTEVTALAKKCAIIHVEAIIKELSTEIAIEASSSRLNFYRQVKTEIENM